MGGGASKKVTPQPQPQAQTTTAASGDAATVKASNKVAVVPAKTAPAAAPAKPAAPQDPGSGGRGGGGSGSGNGGGLPPRAPAAASASSESKEAPSGGMAAKGAGSPTSPPGAVDDAPWADTLESGEVDGMLEHKGGLKGLKLKVTHESSSSDDEDDVAEEEANETWLEEGEELVDLDDLKQQYNSQLLDPEVNDLLEHKGGLRGLTLKAADKDSSDDDEDSDADDDVMDDWLDGEEEMDATEDHVEDDIEVAVSDLFEESTWTHMDALTVVFDRAGLDKKQQQKIIDGLREQVYEPGENIVTQGEMGDKFFIITEGEVVIKKHLDGDPPGAEPKVITHLYQGHFFGETSLATQEPRNATVQAVRDKVRCMYLTKEQFDPLLKEDDRFRQMIQELVNKKEETARKRAELGRLRVGEAPEEKRNDVKISGLHRYGRTKDKNLVINDYVLIKKLGAGSFGQVHLALCLSNGKAYAMKIVDRAMFRKKTLKSDEDMLREVAVMKRLQHRNVVALYEVIDDPRHDKFYLVVEYMKGDVVMKEEETNEPIEVGEARKICRDLLCGLDYLHFQGVVHRDIKPGNILRAQDGTCKLADFGASALTDGETDLIPATDQQGTPAYMAPELFKDGIAEYHGFAVDVWAVGCTLYNLVVGVPPFMANTHMKLVELLSKEEPRVSPVVEANPHLRNLLKRMLEKDPAKRITLEEAVCHDWVTDEGVEPLTLVQHTRLALRATQVHYDGATEDGESKGESKGEGKEGGGGASGGSGSPGLEGGKGMRESRVDSERDMVADLPATRSGIGIDKDGRDMTLDDDTIPVAESPGVDDRSDTGSVEGGSRRGSTGAGESRGRVGRRGTDPSKPKYSMSIHNMNASPDRKLDPSNYNSGAGRVKHLKTVKTGLAEAGGEKLSEADRDKLVDRMKTETWFGVSPARAEVFVEDLGSDSPGGMKRSLTAGDEEDGTASPHSVPPRSLSSAVDGRDAAAGAAGAAAVAAGAAGAAGSGAAGAAGAGDEVASAASEESGLVKGASTIGASSSGSLGGDGAGSVAEGAGGSVGGESSGTTPRKTLSSQQSLARMGSLRRQADFVMVSERVDSGKQKAVIIRSKSGKSFSSVTTGASSVASSQSSGAGGPPEIALPIDSHVPEPVDEGDEEDEEDSDVKPASDDSDDSDESEEEDDDLGDVATLDDMEGGGAITADLDNMFDSLMAPVEEEDPILDELSKEDEAEWSERRFKLDASGGDANETLGFMVGHHEAQGDRASMEDRSTYFHDLGFALKEAGRPLEDLPPMGFFGVYDGHNGSATAEYLHQHLHLNIAAAEGFASEDPSSAIIAGCKVTDAELYERAGDDISDPSGSTANFLLIRGPDKPTDPPTLYCGNVGDSRCVLSRGGESVDLSIDHQPKRQDERERVEAAGGWIVKGRLHGVLAVTRSFGDVEHKGRHKEILWDKTFKSDPLICEPEISQELLLPEDEFVVLACDGVWDVMTSQQVVNFVRHQLLADANVQRAAEALVAKALQLATIDNVSCEIVAFHQFSK